MRKTSKKNAVRMIFVYLLLTAGSYMFLKSCSNSYNRLSGEKIAPASLVINGETASVSVLEHKFSFNTDIISPESKLYYTAYLLCPDDIRLMAYFISLCDKM
ncbi:MAG: hypothetical protein K2F73_06205 [Ruminococcus sp.]|nr:hypothetical protein [Ruminococcus sp.]MDE6102549.1 hypothetical protein [Ruminococcus sp.]